MSQCLQPPDFARLYERFEAPVSRFDCGRHCAPLNGGEPVCCSTRHAIPVMDRAEWRLLRGRTRMWRPFHPRSAVERREVGNLADSCLAAQCRGARHCERDNRALSCRTFPFFPYLTRAGAFVGLAYYWAFEDRCWVISNLGVVGLEFVRQFVEACETIFERDPDERQVFLRQSADMRRVFARWRRPIPLIGRDGGYCKVLRGGRIVPAEAAEFAKHGPYRSARAYAQAVAEAQR